MKIGIAQIKTHPTRLGANVRKINSSIDRAASAGLDLVVFPELAVSGYSCLDNFLNPEFVSANIEALDRIIAHTRGKEVTVFVGFVDQGPEPHESGQRRAWYNSVAVVRDGVLLDIIDKTLLPDYDIFWEKRYFSSARRNHPVEVKGIKVGLEICEDLWDRTYPEKVSERLIGEGAEILINVSASPFHPGKVTTRAGLIREVVEKSGVPFIYTNLVGAQDGYDGEIVFDGRSMVFSGKGELLGLCEGFREEFMMVDVHAGKSVALPDWSEAQEVHDALVMGIRDYCERCGFERVYIGLSGGIDSAVTAALAVEALGAENVIGVTMPSHITSEETRLDALELAKNLGISCHLRPIVEQYQSWLKSAEAAYGREPQSLTKQNVQARLRGQILMEYTNEDRRSLVLSTGNKTELALGYCTLYGDMCGGLAVIGDVSKLLVYDLARLINARAGCEKIPQTTIDRIPTAELEEGQTDAANLPADYDILSPLVDDIVERQLPYAELIKRYDQKIVDRTLRLIAQNEYKRRQAAPSFRVSEKAFGGGRRLPLDALSVVDW